jgi:putrescine---pyruvate transaminase
MRSAASEGPPRLWYQGQVQTALARRGGPLRLVRGEGSRVWDTRGASYIDARSGLWAVLLGYGRTDVIDAVAAQLHALSFAPLTDTVSPVAQDLAARLAALLPDDLRTIALVPTGSEAVDTALKIGRLYHHAAGRRGRSIVIGREYSAHGSTFAGSSLSDPDRGLLRGMGPRLSGVRWVPAPYRYRCRFCAEGPACTLACADAVEEAIVHAGPEHVAMVLAEPVPGPGGVIVPPDEYWPRLRAVCDRHGVVLAADEVVTGFGRTGYWFACERWGTVPDLMILGKGMTGGYMSLGAVAMRGHIAERLAGRLLPHGFTYSGHPAACAAALACLRAIEAEGLPARAASEGARLLEGLRHGLAACPIAGEVRGLGLMCAVELVEDRASRAPLRLGARLLDRLDAALRRSGVLCFVDNPIILAPPLVITDDEVDRIVNVVCETVNDFVRHRPARRTGTTL